MDNNESKVEKVDEEKLDEEELGDEPVDDDTTDWKAEALKARGIAKRNATKLKKAKEANKAPESEKEKTAETVEPITKKGFDYGEKAFLKASDIKSDEYDFVREVMDNTGKSLDDVLESKYFKAELKERREEIGTKDAIPSGSKRSSSSTKDTVDYWIAKDELPKDNPELSRKVVNARIAKEKSKSNFTSNPVV